MCLWHLYCACKRCQCVQGRILGTQRKVSAPWGLSSPLAPTELPGKPGMEAVGLGVEGGGQCGSKWAEEVLGRLLPSHWQDLVNVLLQRVAAQLTHTNLSSVHLPGRLRSHSVSTADYERFPARVRGGWWEDRGRKWGKSGAWGRRGVGGGSMWNCPCWGLPSRWAIWKTRAASRVTRPLLNFYKQK